MITVISSFAKLCVFKLLSAHTLKRKAGIFKVLWFEEGFRKATF